jgi:NAD(P)-dependent dehydrogenase (short-subunit alcohol dehydrogenase family)/acyl dehydratase
VASRWARKAVTDRLQTQDGLSREICFDRAEIDRFALASGDCNPLHVDASFARRTPFGGCVVHGALVAVGLLGVLPEPERAAARALRIRFAGPVLPGDTHVAVARPSRRPGAWEVQLTGRGKVLARLTVSASPELVAGNLAEPAALEPGDTEAARPMRTVPADPDPEELSAGACFVGRYTSGGELAALARDWGAASLHPGLLEGLAWASYVVGMEIPGLHSLLAGVTLAAAPAVPAAPAELHRVTVREHDLRTGQLVLAGGLWDGARAPVATGAIECFALAPVPPPDPAAVGLRGSPPPERGSVVVIGASRGFGAALTLALLARGFRVHGIYASSSEAAAELVRLAGPARDRLQMHQLDARDRVAVGELARTLTPVEPLAGVILGAAPPPLAMGLTGESAFALTDYIAESVRLAAVPLGSLLGVLRPDAWVLFCSSSALLAPPRDWPHYVSAKGALEGLARWLAATAPGLRTVVLRAPALRTELTNTPSGRLAAVDTETVASRVVDRLSGGELGEGLSVLEPNDLEEVPT